MKTNPFCLSTHPQYAFFRNIVKIFYFIETRKMNKIKSNNIFLMRPSEAFLKSLQPLFMISRLFGVMPLQWDSDLKTLSVCPLLLWTSSFILGAVVLSAWFFFIMYFMPVIQYGNQWSSKIFCDSVVILLFIFLNNVSYTTMIYSVHRYTHNIIGILNSFAKVDKLFLIPQTNVDHNRVYWRCWAQISYVLISWLLTVGTAIYAYADKSTSFYNIPLYLLRLVVSCHEQQIVAWCLLAAERFLAINRSLTALANMTGRQDCGLPAWEVKQGAPSRQQHVELETVQKLRCAHALTSHILERINATYQATLLANLVCLFFTLVTFSYFFTAWGFRHDVQGTTETKQVLLSISAVFESVSRTLLLVWVGGTVAYQGQSAGKFVHRVPWIQLKPDVASELQQFSLQVLHEKTAISVCGLFNLDQTLIFTMAGSVCTYLIILIQL